MTIVDYILQADPSGMLTALGKTQKALKDVDQQADKTSTVGGTAAKSLADKFEHAGARLKGVGSTMTLGVTAPLTAAFGLMARSAAEDAASQEILARNLKQMGSASEEAIAGAEDYISELSKMSGTTDDELRPAMSKLISATGDTTKAQELLALALDTSVSKGKPLEAVTQALARGYQGSTTSLGKLGIATKDAEGKALSFSQIQAQLKTQTDGAAKAYGETAAGGAKRAQVAFGELSESLGQHLLPFMATLADTANGVLDFFDKLGPGGSTAAMGIGALAIAFGPVTTGVGTIMQNSHAIIGWFRNLGSSAATAGAHAKTAASGVSSLVSNLGSVGSMAGGVSGVGDNLSKAGAHAKTAAGGVQTMGSHLSTVGNLGSASGGVASIGSHFQGIGKHSGDAATGVETMGSKLGAVGSIAKGLGVTAIIAGITFAIERAVTATDRFKENWAASFEAAKTGPTALLEHTNALVRRFEEIQQQPWLQQLWGYWFGDYQGVVDEMERGNDALQITQDVAEEAAGKLGVTWYQVTKLADAMKLDLGTGSDEVRTKIYDAAAAILAAGGDLQTFVNGTGEAKQHLLDVAAGAAGAAGGIGEVGEAAEEAVDPLDELKKTLDGIFDPILNWDEAKAQFAELGLEMDKLAKDTSVAGLEQSLAAERMARDWVESYQTMMEAAGGLEASELDQQRITQMHIDKLSELGRKFPEVRGVADSYIKKLKETPGDLLTNARVTAPVKFVEDYKGALEDIDRDRITTLKLKYANAQDEFMMRLLVARDLGLSGAQAVKLAQMKMLARGGPVALGEMAIVGERGPELVTFGASGRVHDAATTQRMLSPSTAVSAPTSITVNVAGSVISERDLVQVVEDGLARQRRQSGSLAFLN